MGLGARDIGSGFTRRRVLVGGVCFALMGLALPVEAEKLQPFLRLSAELCGFSVSELEPETGVLYLRTLETLDPGPLAKLLGLAKETFTLESLKLSGVFNDPATEALSVRIIELWYSGVRGTLLGSEVVCYERSLGWRALDFAKPPTFCGPSWWT